MTTISGTIPTVPEVRTHTDAPSKTVNNFTGGELLIGTYSNTGNVPQTITFTGLTATNNASLANGSNSVIWQPPNGSSIVANSITLNPGTVDLYLKITVPVQAPGAPQQSYTFDVGVTWS